MPASNHAEVLVALLDGPKTRAELGISQAKAEKMLNDEVVRVTGTAKKTDARGRTLRGRPSLLYRATSKGRARGKRHAAVAS